jgi:hypothetical protein
MKQKKHFKTVNGPNNIMSNDLAFLTAVAASSSSTESYFLKWQNLPGLYHQCFMLNRYYGIVWLIVKVEARLQCDLINSTMTHSIVAVAQRFHQIYFNFLLLFTTKNYFSSDYEMV